MAPRDEYGVRRARSWVVGSPFTFCLREQRADGNAECRSDLLQRDDRDRNAATLDQAHVGSVNIGGRGERLLRIFRAQAQAPDGSAELFLDGEHTPRTVAARRVGLYSRYGGAIYAGAI